MKKVLILSVWSVCVSFSAMYAQQQRIVTVHGGNQINITTDARIEYKVLAKAAMEFMYDYQYLRDTTDAASVVKDIMILQVGYGISKFSGYRTMQIDSLINASAGDQIAANPSRFVGGETFAVYKNYPAGKFTHTDKISTDWFLYEEDIPVQDWKLTEGIKIIEGYECRRAECDFRGRRYVAWYTDEIPVADGPWKFGGLPGFIMEVSDNKGHYSFMLTGITSQASRDITLPDVQYNKTSRDKFYKAKRRYDADPFGYMSSVSGVDVVITTPDGVRNDEAMKPRELQYDYIERDHK